MRQGGWGWGLKKDLGADAEDCAGRVQDCLEIEPGIWESADRDNAGLRGVHLRHRQGCSTDGGQGLRICVVHSFLSKEVHSLGQVIEGDFVGYHFFYGVRSFGQDGQGILEDDGWVGP